MGQSTYTGELNRTLGLPSLFAVAVGVVVSQVVFVSILQGVGIGGASFFVAMLIAFVLTLCYVFTYSELALLLPKAGSISSYTEVAIGHFPAIVASIAGYLAPAIFGLPAELFLMEYILDVLYPGSFVFTGVIILVMFTILNLIGVDLFSKVQSLLSYLMLTSMVVIGVVGLTHSDPRGLPISSIVEGISHLDFNVFNLTMLALWSFFALEFVCPLIEETKNPKKNIPRSMIGASGVLLVIYLLIALAGYRSVPVGELTGSDIPHWLLVLELFGEKSKLIMAVLAITATCSTINTVIATLPRMLFGMAHNNQMPKIFMKIHPKTKAPWVGIIFVASIILIPTLLLGGKQDIILTLMISAGTIWLIAYIIAHIDLMVLRKKYPTISRPFKSPWYPFPQIIGIIGMVYMILHNSPSPDMTRQVYLNAGIILLIAGTFAWWWVKYKMKKKLFEPEPIENVISE
ncbi:APC family permease [Cyclobacteriaceae bacterium YHN15]|nr:APC family permease [Cyclobacteriaceae bacterium YHN15]